MKNSEQSDEIDLIELYKILVRRKFFIIVLMVLAVLASAYYSFTLPTVYKTKLLMIPSHNDNTMNLGAMSKLGSMVGGNAQSSVGIEGERSLVVLKTRAFLVDFIKENNLKPVLFSNIWDQEANQWKNSEPSDEDAYEFMRDMIVTKMHSSHEAAVIALTIQWKNLKTYNNTGKITNSLIHKLNSSKKEKLVNEAKQKLEFLKKEIEKTDFVELKEGLYGLIEKQTGNLMTLNIGNRTVFEIIDPAIDPIKPESRNTSIIILIGLFLGLFLGSIIVLIIHVKKDR